MKTNNKLLSDLLQPYAEITAMFAGYYKSDTIMPHKEKDKERLMKSRVHNILCSVTLIADFDYFDKIYKYSEKGNMSREEALRKSEQYRDVLTRVDNYLNSKLFRRSQNLIKTFAFCSEYLESVADSDWSLAYQYDECTKSASLLGEKLLKASEVVDPIIKTVNSL